MVQECALRVYASEDWAIRPGSYEIGVLLNGTQSGMGFRKIKTFTNFPEQIS
jgi:hypothetical protein